MYYLIVTLIVTVIIFKLYMKLSTGWCRSQTCLIGKTAIITGANGGIGYHTAVDLAKRGARVIIACRDKEKALEASEKILQETSIDNVVIKIVDFASLKSVRKFSDDIKETEKRLDILVNNAGCMGLGKTQTEDGLNAVVQVNYFAPFLLTNLLLDLLRDTENSRVVNVASLGAKFVRFNLNKFYEYPKYIPYAELQLYFVSKMCNVMFTIELANRLQGTTVTTYSLHPGVVATQLFRNSPNFLLTMWNFILNAFFKSSEEGAQTSIYCSVARGIEKFSGQHFHDCHMVKRYWSCQDTSMAKKLWDKTEEIISRATRL